MTAEDPRLTAFARDIEDLRREVKALKTPQLAHSAIVDGALAGWDDEQQVETMQIGLQYDGTNVAASLTGPTPPTPDAPIVAPGQNSGVVVTWNSIFADALVAPMDFARVDVHVGDAGVDETYPIANSILSARGGDAFVSLEPGTYWVVLVTRVQNGKASEPSEKVSFTVTAPSVSDGEAPSAVGTITAQGMVGAVALRWAAVDNNDPVTYKIYGQHLAPGQTTFAINEADLVAETAGSYAVLRSLANDVPFGYEETVVEQVTIDTMSRGSIGEVNCLTPQNHPWVEGDTVELAGVDGHPEIDGTWQIMSTDFLGGGHNTNYFQLRTPVTGSPFSNYDPTATATRTITRTAAYGFRIVAVDADGSAAPSPMIAGTPVKITSDDIAAYSISAEMLQAGSVTAESLAAEIVLATRFLTAETGARLDLGPAGLAIYAPDGSLAFNFPTFSTNPEDPLTATVRAEIDALSIAVQDYLTLNGQENQINKGARLRLSTGTTRPSKGSTPIVSWDSKTTPVLLNSRGLTKLGTAWYTSDYAGIITRLIEQEDRFVHNGSWSFATSGVGASHQGTSIVALGGFLWAMTLAQDPVNQYYNYFRIRKYAYTAGTDNWAQVGNGWRFHPTTLLGHDGIGHPILTTDGTDLIAVQSNKNGWVNVFKATTANPGSWSPMGGGSLKLAPGGPAWIPNNEMRAAAYGWEHSHPRTLTQYSRPASTAGTLQTITLTTAAAHGFIAGEEVRLSSSVFNGNATVGSTPTPTTFTIHSTAGVAGTGSLLGTVQPWLLYTTRAGTPTGAASKADAWTMRAGGEWVASSMDTFTFPVGAGNTGLVWDPSLSAFRSRFGESIFTHTNLSWTDEPSRWWSSLTLYRASGPYETEQGPKTQFTPPKRAKVTLSHPALPPASIPPSSSDPTAYRVYIGRSETEPVRTKMDRIDEIVLSPGKTTISTLPAFPVTPTNYPPTLTDMPFPASIPAEIAPAANIGPAFLRGDGTSWLDPFGSIAEYGGAALPEGWLWCNGATVSQALYPRLYEAIGTRWNTGGEPAGTFRLPMRVGTDLAWSAIAAASGWTSSASVRIVNGEVRLKGYITRASAASGTYATTVTLATRYRPAVQTVLPPARPATMNDIVAQTNGDISVTGTTGGGTLNVWLGGMHWPQESWFSCDSNYIIRAA